MVVVAYVNVRNMEAEHAEHAKHEEHEETERISYPYMGKLDKVCITIVSHFTLLLISLMHRNFLGANTARLHYRLQSSVLISIVPQPCSLTPASTSTVMHRNNDPAIQDSMLRSKWYSL